MRAIACRIHYLTLPLVLWGICFATVEAAENSAEEDGTTRIVSLVPAITEFIYALNAQEVLVGTSSFCNYPEEAKTKPRLGGYLNPSLEKMIALRPTHLLLMHSQTDLIEKLNRLGVQPIPMKTDSLADVFASVRTMSAVVDKQHAAEELIREIERDLADLKKETARTGRRVLIIVGREPQSLRGMYAAGPETYLGEIIGIAGGQNVTAAGAQPYPTVTKEQIVSWNPSVIIDTSLGEPEKSSVWKQLHVVDAVAADRVYFVTDQHDTIPGPHIATAARRFHRMISSSETVTTFPAGKSRR